MWFKHVDAYIQYLSSERFSFDTFFTATSCFDYPSSRFYRSGIKSWHLAFKRCMYRPPSYFYVFERGEDKSLHVHGLGRLMCPGFYLVPPEFCSLTLLHKRSWSLRQVDKYNYYVNRALDCRYWSNQVMSYHTVGMARFLPVSKIGGVSGYVLKYLWKDQNIADLDYSFEALYPVPGA